MLYWAGLFLAIAILAAIFGFSGFAAPVIAGTGKFLFVVFTIITVLAVIFARQLPKV